MAYPMPITTGLLYGQEPMERPYEETHPVPQGFSSWDEWRRYDQIKGPLGPSGLPITPSGLEYTPARGITISRETPEQAQRRMQDVTDPYILYDKKDAAWREAHKLNYQIDMMEAGDDPFLQQIAQQEHMQGLGQLDAERQQNRVMIKAIEDDEDTDDREKSEAITKVLDKSKAPIRLLGVTRIIEQRQQQQRQQQLLQQEPQRQTQQQLETATVLRKEFQASKAYTDYEVIQRSERGMKQAYTLSIDPKTKSKVASDQALAVLFQKMLDPASVVRESEYARTPEGVGIINRIQSWIPKLQKGGMAISNSDRKALYDMGQRLLDEAKTVLDTHIYRYIELSNLYGIDPKYVLGGIKPSGYEDIQNMSDEELEKIATGRK